MRVAAGQFHPTAGDRGDPGVDRYRKKLIEQHTSELRRLAKVLEDSGIMIDSVASALTTLSARDMIEALIAGERDPAVLANLARGRMHSKIPDLGLACAGRFGDQHALMCTLHLEHIDHLTGMIARLDTRIDEASLPVARQTSLLATIPGISERAAQVIISKIGIQMSRFPTTAHLASWAGLCPGNNQHLRRCPVPPLPSPVRQEGRIQGRHRHRPHPHCDHLACTGRDHRLPRPGLGLLHPPHR